MKVALWETFDIITHNKTTNFYEIIFLVFVFHPM